MFTKPIFVQEVKGKTMMNLIDNRDEYRKGFREGYELYERENIVHCKNCIHARHNETFPEKYECRFSSTLRKKDDFCSEGETEEDFK